MANVLVEEQTLTDIADAIREKNSTENTYKPSEMPQAVRNIQSDDTGVGSRQWWLDVCSKKISFSSMFYGCSSLTEIPQIDTSNGTSFSYMFNGCSSLTEIPQIDTSNGTTFQGMFYGCSSLTEIPQIDTSNGTSFSYMFNGCSSLTEIPQIDTSKAKGVALNSMFDSCSSLISIPLIDTSRNTSFSSMFNRCVSLTTIPLLDTSNVSSFINTFTDCHSLKEIRFVANKIKLTISFAQSPLLSDESIQSIIDGLADFTGQTAKTLTLHALVKEKLTDEQIAQITSKNWTLA